MREGGGTAPHGIDWEALRTRLAVGSSGADPAEAADAERRILAERARILARPAHDPEATAHLDLVSFTLGGERWGLEARLAWEVFAVVELARLPGASAPVAGITAWRGLILPVLDLRSVLGMRTAPLDDLRFAVVLGADRPTLCILADSVQEVGTVMEADLADPPDGMTLHRDLLLGVTRAALPVLNGAHLVERYG
jgi:purine-binding chemotaxis protein CheW